MSLHTRYYPRRDFWKPKPYPVQSSEHGSTYNSRWSSVTAADSPQYPKSIRAVQDSNLAYQGRTLIICLDGTGDKFDNDNSNVVNFVACLKKDDPNQVTYYQSGIGTYDGSGLKTGFSAGFDMAVGSGLGIHVRDAYRFLMQNYREGDRICLLGFSRGSYTVRCLAGMLHKVGLLPAHNRAQITFAYQFYKDDTPEGWKMSADFKKTFSNDVTVFFVGVWDCVASVGFIPRKLPFSKSPTNAIRYFRHAMALDEHRAKFKICRYTKMDEQNHQHTIDCTPKAQIKGGIRRMLGSCFGPSEAAIKREEEELRKRKAKEDQARLEAKFDKHNDRYYKPCETDVLEVWFMGAHADVGGGAVANDERSMLSRIPLRWMIRQTFECNTGILFNTAALAETGIDVPSVWPVYKPLKKPICGPSPKTLELFEKGKLPPLRRRSTALGVDDALPKETPKKETYDDLFLSDSRHSMELDLLPEQVEDYFDSRAPINDQLVQAKGWWILEFWPVKVRIQKKDSDDWEKHVRLNMGRYRVVQDKEPNIHWTVDMRINDGAYKNRARVDRSAVWKVVA